MRHGEERARPCDRQRDAGNRKSDAGVSNHGRSFPEPEMHQASGALLSASASVERVDVKTLAEIFHPGVAHYRDDSCAGREVLGHA